MSRDRAIDPNARHLDESYAIVARAVTFDWTGVPLQYIPHEWYATHFWNVMHLVLPEGERAMADVFALALRFLGPCLHIKMNLVLGTLGLHILLRLRCW